jgi:hypothetical protein
MDNHYALGKGQSNDDGEDCLFSYGKQDFESGNVSRIAILLFVLSDSRFGQFPIPVYYQSCIDQ